MLPDRLPGANQVFLGSWVVDIHQEGHTGGETQHTWDGTPTAHPGNPVAGMGEVIRHTAPGESALAKHLVTWAAGTWEGHKTQAQPSLCLCGVPEDLNLSGLDLGSARNTGPASDSAPAEQPGAWAV